MIVEVIADEFENPLLLFLRISFVWRVKHFIPFIKNHKQSNIMSGPVSPLAGTFFANRSSMEGKVAVVTGAASGIGLEFSKRLVTDYGMTVLMADVDKEALARAWDQLSRNTSERNTGKSGKAIMFPMNVRKRADFVRLLDLAQQQNDGSVDVCLFNAGVSGAGINVLSKDRLDSNGKEEVRSSNQEADWRWVLDVNLFGVLHGLQVFTPAMSRQGRPGLVSVTASDRGLDIGGVPGCTASYATSKHALLGLCEALEGELARRGLLATQIQLAVLCPGLVASSLWDTGRAESQRAAEDRRALAAQEGPRRFMEEWGTPVSDAIDTFLEDVSQGRFLCDSVPGQLKNSFERRAGYVLNGCMPSDRRIVMPPSSKL